MAKYVFLAITIGVSVFQFAAGQELLLNGDFETLATSGDPPTVTKDAFGNAIPVDWFRSGTEHPTKPGVALAELIGPESGDPPDDSDGNGQYSAALNATAQQDHSDWRSRVAPTVPGEELFWSFDFKFLNYVHSGFLAPEGFRIELRSFDAMAPNGGDAGSFAGEQTVWVYVHGYGPDTNGDGVGDSGGYATGGGYPSGTSSVTVMDFDDGQWHTLSSDDFGDQNGGDDNDLWKIPSLEGGNGADGLFTDVRVSVNAFNLVDTDQLQVRIDNVSVFRPLAEVPGDFNGDGTVDAADYVVWRKGTATQEDYALWRMNFGLTSQPPGASLGSALVPEPTSFAICVALVFGFGPWKWRISKPVVI
jgi:hypothetical protein